MTKLKPHKEKIKSILIALLLVSAILLAGKAGYYSAISEKLQAGAMSTDTGDSSSENIESFAGLRPFVVAVTPTKGQMLCVRYNQEDMTAQYSRMSVLLAEAINSITSITEVDENRWHSATKTQSAYLYYYFRIPMSLLAKNIGVYDARLEDISATEIILSDEQGTQVLYLRDGDDVCYACETDMGPAALVSAIEQFEGQQASFAYEDEMHEKLNPYTIICQSDYEISYISAGSAFTSSFDFEPMFSSFSINSKVVKSYPEDSGTVFVENNKTLRIRSDGSLSYSITAVAGEESGKGENVDMYTAVNLALDLMGNAVSPNIGDAILVISSVSYDKSAAAFTIKMEYTVNGILVSLSSGESAATIVVQNGRIESANLRALRFTIGGIDTSVLATAQAIDIADEMGGYLHLEYVEDAKGSFACKWAVN